MLKRLLRPLLEPIAARLDKLLDRTSEGFKKQQERNADARRKQSERIDMLSRQIDESRDEVIRGFARQDAKLAAMKKQLDQVLVRMTKLGAVSASRPSVTSPQIVSQATTPVTAVNIVKAEAAPHDPAADQMVQMLLDAGGAWLESQRGEADKG